MIALFGSIIGLLGSLIPNLLKVYQDKKDKEHEIQMFGLQVEREKLGHYQRMEEISTQADIAETTALYQSLKPSGIQWVDALTATVRPIITYAFFALYVYVKAPMIYRSWWADQYSPYYNTVWTEMDIAIFCTIITFWFGNRTFSKLFIKK